ncbi:hypothetical protein KY289_035803 [Solanum tuberosum]|nr:hypothetical protein KY289_035803 [Solanum tuberosum]
MPQLPSVNQACALVNQDESQKLVAGSSGLVHQNMAPTAMFTSRSGYQKPKEPYAPNAFCDYCHIKCHSRADCNKLLECDHCHKTGHLKVVYFRLIGYLPDYKGKREVVVAGNFVYDTGCVTGSVKSPLNPPNYYPMLQTCVPSVQASLPQQRMMPKPMFTQGQHQQLLRMLEKNFINETTSSANMTGKVQLPTGDSANVSHIGDYHIRRGSLIWEGESDWLGRRWSIHTELSEK